MCSCSHAVVLCVCLSSDICIATAISLLMILICGMATYGAYKVSKQKQNDIHTHTRLNLELDVFI